jgi:hypothetical protein
MTDEAKKKHRIITHQTKNIRIILVKERKEERREETEKKEGSNCLIGKEESIIGITNQIHDSQINGTHL